MNFIINRKTKDPDSLRTIYARVHKTEYSHVYSTGLRISIEEWNMYRKNRYIASETIPSIGITFHQFVKILKNIKKYFDEEYTHEEANDKILEIVNRGCYNTREVILFGVNTRKSVLLDEYIMQYYRDLLDGKRLNDANSQKVKKDSARNYYFLHRLIIGFQKTKRIRLCLEDVNMDFQRAFVSWLKDRRYKHNGINTYLKKLKRVMRCAFNEHLTENDITKYANFTLRELKVESIHLTPEQIEILYNLNISTIDDVKKLIVKNIMDVSERDRLIKYMTEEKVISLRYSRDIFLVGCYTGQRFSDYSRINTRMVRELDEGLFIHFVQRKTKKRLFIPLDYRVKEILDRNNGVLPKIPLEKFIRSMEELFKCLGWTWDVIADDKNTGRKFSDKIGSHTARRSFVTNAYLAGIENRNIMFVTGHSTEKVFRNYLQLSEKDKALMAAEALDGFMQL